jgi:hypothetical protein
MSANNRLGRIGSTGSHTERKTSDHDCWYKYVRIILDRVPRRGDCGVSMGGCILAGMELLVLSAPIVRSNG